MSNILNKYTPGDYAVEKILGVRKSTGELKLVRLKGVHRQIIAYHLRGLSNRDIAGITGHAEISISRILRDPLSQAYIQEYLAGIEMELQGLAGVAVDTLRNAITSPDANLALNAVDKYFRATGRYANAEKNVETAEDAIARALEAIGKQADAISDLSRGNSAKVINMPTSAKRTALSNNGEIIDADVTEVSDGDSIDDRAGETGERGTLIRMDPADRDKR